MKNSTKYRQITSGQRILIQAMLKAGYLKAEIARETGCHRSSIGREIKRGSVEQLEEVKTTSKRIEIPLTTKVIKYFADTGQREHDERRQKCRKRYAIFKEEGYADFIDKLILSDPRRYSPDTANAMARREGFKGVSTKTLYNWIDGGLLKVKNIDLLLKVKRKPAAKIKEQKRIIGESIDNRPESANNRSEFGHFEGDSVVGKDHTGQIITLVERQARIGLMFKFDKMDSDNIVSVLQKLKERYGQHFKDIFKSITFDNGSEFAYYDKMKAIVPEIYYAHAYRSCERGSDENFNGLIRRFIPKGKDFRDLTDSDIDRINHWINTIPRKLLGYKTALEVFREKTAFLTA